MSSKSTKAKKKALKNSPSGEISDSLWNKHQVQSAKGSDMTITEEITIDNVDEFLDECYNVINDCCEDASLTPKEKRELDELREEMKKG